MPPIMQNTTNLNKLSRHAVVDSEGEPPHQGATQCPVYGATGRRHTGDVPEGAVEFALELRTKTRTALFIPRKSLRDIRRGFRPEFQPIRHGFLGRSFARTWSQVSPGPGVGLSSRRSSSALCQSGTGTSSGVAARLSQISSSNFSRSGAGSCRISSRSPLGVMIPIWQRGPTLRNLRAWRRNGLRLSCGALKKDSFPNLRAPAASSAC